MERQYQSRHILYHSPNHSSSVPLILITRTGLVTPQFHCLFDDDFATCKKDVIFESSDTSQLPSHFHHPWDNQSSEKESSHDSNQAEPIQPDDNVVDSEIRKTRSGRIINAPIRLTYKAIVSSCTPEFINQRFTPITLHRIHY